MQGEKNRCNSSKSLKNIADTRETGKRKIAQVSGQRKHLSRPPTSDVGIPCSGADGGVSEEGLNEADVGSRLMEMSGKEMAKAMEGDMLVDAHLCDGLVFPSRLSLSIKVVG